MLLKNGSSTGDKADTEPCAPVPGLPLRSAASQGWDGASACLGGGQPCYNLPLFSFFLFYFMKFDGRILTGSSSLPEPY